MYRQTHSSFVDRKPFGGRSTSRSGDSFVPAEHPPSPPDTESLSSHPYAPSRRPSHPDNYLPTIPGTPDMHESAGARFRRLSGFPTSHSGSREFRGASRPQTRWLIVLMPPSNLIDELSVGHRSPGKLSSGLLVPLFPTLFAQLAAIAKEFNLPSTTGLCLYLHLQDAPDAPRITDDVWPLLWARHLHTDDASLPLGLPVAGRVQFDIDIPSARWYPMWFAHVSRKELVPDLARAIPTSPRAVEATLGDSIRGRGVPRPLALAPRQERAVEVQIDSGPSPGPSPSKPTIPKSASKETVEKVRRWSALVTPEPAALRPSDDSAPLPTEDTHVPATESTAVDDSEDVEPAEPEPLNLEDFQWSVSSAGPPSPASSCATTASSRVPSIHLLERVEGSVILTPSTATSWGPQYDSDVESELELDTEEHVRSPDIGERAEGSVLLTPSTATSWGAPLSYPPTPAQWAAMHELVRSPDIGERAEGSVLLTPSTATTWGAPLSYPPTPAQWHALRDHIMRTPDLGHRAEGSVLLTPSTATTWGPPLEYPPTPGGARQREWVPSPGLGDREASSPGRVGRMSAMQWGTEVETEEQAYARMGLAWRWEFGWPSPLPVVREEAGGRWEFGWPMASSLPGVREEAEDDEAGSVQAGSVHDEASATTSVQARSVSASVRAIQVRAIHVDDYEHEASLSGSEHDVESLYDAPFGHSEEQEEAQEREFQFELELESPHVVLVNEERSYAEVEDSHGQEIDEAYGQEAELSYGQAVEMDENYREPSDYAPEDVSVSDASEDRASEASIEDGVFEYSYPDSAAHPSFPVSVSASDDAIGFPDLSPIVQPDSPYLDAAIMSRAIPPAPVLVAVPSVATVVTATAVRTTSLSASTRTYGAYPYLVIYPSVYPHLDLYPSASAANLQTKVGRPAVGVNTQSTQRNRSISPVYSRQSTPSPVESLRSQSLRSPPFSRRSSLSITVPTTRSRSRSILAINPADKRSLEWSKTLPPVPPVPHSLKSGSISSVASFKSVGQGSTRPASLRSVREGSVGSITSIQEEATSVTHQPRSEDLRERRPSVVHNNVEFELLPSKKFSPQSLSSAYPFRYPENLEQLYPHKETIGYPANLERIYPVLSKAVRSVSTVPVEASSVGKTSNSGKSLAISLTTTYPVFNLYPAVYPHNLGEIYPSVSSKPFVPSVPAPAPLAITKARNVGMSMGYPFIEIYPAVYPHNLQCLYPSVSKEVVAPKQAAKAQLPSSQPTVMSSPLAYPFNLDNIYPKVTSRSSSPAAAAPGVRLARTYPNIEIYPPVYPFNLDIYPSVKAGNELEATSSSKSRGPIVKSSGVRLARTYPNIEIYPPVYPFNLEVYPLVNELKTTSKSQGPIVKSLGVRLVRTYPNIEIYPPVYPFNLEIYPSVKARNELGARPRGPTVKSLGVRLARTYPNIEIYAPVYPFNLEIYPSVKVGNEATSSQKPRGPTVKGLGVRLARTYPNIEIYAPVYPFNLEIYPSVKAGNELGARPREPTVKSLGVRLARTYPNIEIYAPVYPFNLEIYPSVKAGNKLEAPKAVGSGVEVVGNSSKSVESPGTNEIGKVQKSMPPARKNKKTHAQLHAETWRKTHAQLVAEVSAPVRPRKSHTELEAEVFLNGLPATEDSPVGPYLTITPVQSGGQEPKVEHVSSPIPEPESEPAPAPLVTPLRRQRSGTIMRPRTESLPVPPLGTDLGRSRSMVEARTQMFERSPSRSQTAGPQGPLKTLVRQKSASFERAKSLFHTPEETQSEGSRTPPRPIRRVSKLDMSKFGFA